MYLVYGMEVLVVEVPEEPEDTRSQDLPEQHHKGGQVEDEDHSCKPVQEHHCACMRGEGGRWACGMRVGERGK